MLLFIFREQALSLFTDDAEVIKQGASYLRIVLFTMIPFSFMFIITGVLRGAGDMLWGLILTGLSLWVIRVPLVYWLSFSMGADGIWYGMAISFVAAYILGGAYYLTGNWKKKALVKRTTSEWKNDNEVQEDLTHSTLTGSSVRGSR
jgi:Na+-driven multidrug efflux pump